ncbi:MAG: hypothetical protein M3421_12520 [Bacteroidota bacterium]|nr:hypothetical protein [Bacteroidota bacterium]
MSSKRYQVLCFILGLACYSCAPLMYKPNMVNTPQLSEKNEFKGSGNINITTPALDIQTAYALSDHIGIMANISTGGKIIITDTTNSHKHTFGELGVGYFYKLGDNAIFAFFGGFGRGRASAIDREKRLFGGRRFEYIDGFYNRWFLQGEVGAVRRPANDLKYRFVPSLAIRYTNVYFSKYESNYPLDNFLPRRVMIEIAPTFRISNGLLSFIVQPGFSLPFLLYPNNDKSSFMINPFMIHVGMEFINKKRKSSVLE